MVRTRRGDATHELLANVRLALGDGWRTLAVVGAQGGGDAAMVASRLARAVAASGARTCLVECDLGGAPLEAALALRTRRGVADVAAGTATAASAAVRAQVAGLWYVGPGSVAGDPVDALATAGFRDCVAQLAGAFDAVVLDAPPAVGGPAPSLVAREADATLVVVRDHAVPRDGARRAVGRMRDAGARVVGAVLVPDGPRWAAAPQAGAAGGAAARVARHTAVRSIFWSAS